jgi:hypothetical protein
MRHHSLYAAATVLVLTCLPLQAVANNCVMGAKVTDRQNRTGTVIMAKGSDCRVKFDDGSERYYLAWMLSPAGTGTGGKAAGAAGAPRNGTYHCVAAGGVAGTLQLVIKGGNEYSDRSGKSGRYNFDAATGKITFQSGGFSGYFGKLLGPAKIGLSSRDGGFYGTVCDMK